LECPENANAATHAFNAHECEMNDVKIEHTLSLSFVALASATTARASTDDDALI